jgi:Transglycosylase SLT domain
MKVSLAALLLAGCAFAAISGAISCVSCTGLNPSETSGNIFAVNNFWPTLRAFRFTWGLRRAGPDRDAAIIDDPGAASPETGAHLTLADIHALIGAAAKKYQVPAAFVKSIVAAESNFNCDVVSLKGAIGLMQLVPATAREYGADPTIPEQNIEAGTHYLKFLMQKYRKSRHPLTCTIAAYNAGPGAVDRYRGVPPFRETRRYVVRVLAFLKQFSERAQLDL